MKNKRNGFYGLLIIMKGVIDFPLQAQRQNGVQDVFETKDLNTSQGPKSIVRTIKQDRKGNIRIASGDHTFKLTALNGLA